MGTGGGFGVELNLTSLARPPSPAEERAIFLAVEEALRAAITPPSEPEPPRWRFSGRWWRTNTNPGTVFPHCG
jgi:hypothetical protein